MKPRNYRSFLLICFLYSSCVQGHGQMDPRLQVLNSHFAGVWTGTNYDYTKPNMLTTPVRLAITNDPKKKRLRLEYFYGTLGRKSSDHSVRFMMIDPTKSTVILKWEGSSKDVYKAAGLEEILNSGYGHFELSGVSRANGLDVPYRATFRLAADSFYYCWEKSDNSVDYSKTGEWKLTREPITNGSTDTKPSH